MNVSANFMATHPVVVEIFHLKTNMSTRWWNYRFRQGTANVLRLRSLGTMNMCLTVVGLFLSGPGWWTDGRMEDGRTDRTPPSRELPLERS